MVSDKLYVAVGVHEEAATPVSEWLLAATSIAVHCLQHVSCSVECFCCALTYFLDVGQCFLFGLSSPHHLFVPVPVVLCSVQVCP